MDLAQLNREPGKVEIGGVEYRVGRLTFREMARITAWLKGHVPHPVTALIPHLEGLKDAERKFLLDQARREAAESWPPDIFSEEGRKAMLGAVEGQVALLHVILGIHQPHLSVADVETIVNKMYEGVGLLEGMQRLDGILRIAFDLEEVTEGKVELPHPKD
jgi:hypothetical protein